jgi:hypothetical protein
MAKYDMGHSTVYDSIWTVVDAINLLPEFFIEYPSDHEQQKRIAADFRTASQVDFDNCAGALDGILIWMTKPRENDANCAGVGQKKFLCGRKHKFGLNCQAVSDKRGRFLDLSIKYGGATSDCLAFEASDLYRRLSNNLLAPGLALFGDNAYINMHFLATPYSNVSSGSRDHYNYYHSQVSQWLIVVSFACEYLTVSNFNCTPFSFEFGSNVPSECWSNDGPFFGHRFRVRSR